MNLDVGNDVEDQYRICSHVEIEEVLEKTGLGGMGHCLDEDWRKMTQSL